VALGEEIGVSEPNKIHRSDIDIGKSQIIPERAPKRAQPSEKKIGV
jgi:hypothetical protein